MARRSGRLSGHTEVVVLGLLAQQPRHGYEILQIVRDIKLSDWAKVGTATVYTALSQLEKEGCVRASNQRVGGRPARVVYTITALGGDKLANGVHMLLESADPVHSDRLVGAAFSWALPRADAIASLGAAAKRSASKLTTLRGVYKKAASSSHVTRLVLEYLIGEAEAEKSALTVALKHESSRRRARRNASQ